MEPKQFCELLGRTVLLWSLDTVLDAGCAPAVVVVPPGWVEHTESLIDRDLPVEVTEGGSFRQDSVSNGLALVDSSVVVVHDAARPLATADLVRAVVDAVDDADAVVPATPVEDTLKQVDLSERLAVGTIEREGLWRAQTPAAYRTDRLRAAHEAARRDGFTGTDEAQLIEREGGRVRLVRGERTNIKLTYPEDFDMAAAILRHRS